MISNKTQIESTEELEVDDEGSEAIMHSKGADTGSANRWIHQQI